MASESYIQHTQTTWPDTPSLPEQGPDSDGSRNNWMGGQVGFDYVRSRPEQLAQALPVVLLRCKVGPGALRAQFFLSCGVCHGELMWLCLRVVDA